MLCYCCITNYPRSLQLNHLQPFIFSQFCWLRNPGTTYLGASDSRSLMWLQSECWLLLKPHLKACLGEDPLPSSLMWLLAEFNSLWTVGLKASVTHCLLPGGFPQFLAVWAFIEQITTWHWLLSEQASKRARQSTQDGHHSVFITPEASLLPYSIRLKQVTWYSPHSRGGIIQGHKCQEVEITGGTLWGHIRVYVLGT